MLCRALLLICILASPVTSVFAQNSFNFRGESNVNGTVRNFSNAAIRGVRVELREFATGRTVATATTFANGSFEFRHVAAGRYELVAFSGLSEARQDVDLTDIDSSVTLRINDAGNTTVSGSEATVSVSDLKVPDKAKDALQKAEDAFSKSKTDRALELVQKALRVFPRYARALTLRGLLNMQRNDFRSAQADLENAVQVDPQDGMGLIALGSVYNSNMMFDKALAVLNRGVTLSPSSWQAYFELSKAQNGKGEYELALRNATKAMALCPKDWSLLHLARAEALLGLKNYNEAVNELEEYLRHDPNGAASTEVRKTLAQARAAAAGPAAK